MPQHKSAEKRVRQSATRRTRNRNHKVRVRTMIKDLEATENSQEAGEKLRAVKAYIDRMATRGLFHKNTAARMKSRLAILVNNLG